LMPSSGTNDTVYGDTGALEYQAPSHVDIFSKPFEQPSILRAFHNGNGSLSAVQANIPVMAPAQYRGTDGQRTTKKIYAFQLALQLDSMMEQEWPKKFADVEVVVREIIRSDVASVAQVQLETDKDCVVALRSGDVADWAKDWSQLFSLFSDDASDANQQLRATRVFAQSVERHAKLDAGLLRDALYDGAVDDFRRIYDGLSKFVLGTFSAH
jgi:hypothetical protein